MLVRFASAAIAWLVLAGGARAAPPTVETVSRLVGQLDAPALDARQSAARELEAFGPAVLPLLPAAEDIDSPGARNAVEQLRRRLERALATASVQAATVTFVGTAAASDALAALTGQTGNALQVVPEFDPAPSMTLDWQQTPFWRAAGELAQKMRRQISWNPKAELFELLPAGKEPVDVAADVPGPFRVSIRAPQWRQSGNVRLLRVTAVLQAEPRLKPLFVQWPMRDWRLSAGDTDAPAWNPDAAYELPFPDRTSEVTLPLDFRWPNAERGLTWSLAGRCMVHVAAGHEPLSFAGSQLQRGAVVRRNGVSARIQSARFDPTSDGRLSGRVRIVVNYERGGPAFESHRTGLFHRSAWLETDAGRRIPFSGLEITAEADGGLAVEYRFDEVAAPATQYRFLYEAPTLLLEVPVTVRLDVGRLLPPE